MYLPQPHLAVYLAASEQAISEEKVNGKKPASRFTDKLRGISNSKRPNAVAVVRTADGMYKSPCEVCKSLIDFLEIKDINNL